MDIQEIYSNAEVVRVEKELEGLFLAHKPSWANFDDEERGRIMDLLGERKELIDGMFQMTEEHARLLEEFNELARAEIVKMRNKAIEAYNAVCGVADKEEAYIYASGLCFLGRKYPELHPVQGKLEKEMWEILTEEKEEYNAWYDLGVVGMPCRYSDRYALDENEILYLRDRPHNWNEGFDPELTKDMHILYGVNDLFHHTWFAVPDLLWVREFYSEIKVVIDSGSREGESLESFYYNENDPYEPE